MSNDSNATPDVLGQTPEPKRNGSHRYIEWIIVIAIIVFLLVLLAPPSTNRTPSHRTQCKNNLKNIAIAIHSYAEVYGALPPACTVDAAGKPLHSWRTLILPYLDEQALYEAIDLSKSWNDPANANAFNTELLVYRCPSASTQPNQTTYMAIVGSNSCFRRGLPRLFADITDGTSSTLMLIEVPSESAVPWMSPQDTDERFVLGFGPASDLPHTGGTQAAFADGSIRFLEATMPSDARRAMISIAGDDNDAIDR